MKDTIIWKVLLKSNPESVFRFIDSQRGRESFWAERAPERDGYINFEFINGKEYQSKILHRSEPTGFQFEYFNTNVSISFNPVKGGTELQLVNTGIPSHELNEINAGICFEGSKSSN